MSLSPILPENGRKANEYDQEMPQSQTTDLTVLQGKATEHLEPHDSKNIIRVKSGKFRHQVNSDTHLQTV